MALKKEFVALMALSMSLVALAIDAMLPALAEIGSDLGLDRDNDRQLVLTVLFLGLSLGQLFYGPISDSLGRRGPIFFGFGLFILGSALAVVAPTFEWLLIGRFLQGLGAAGPRILTVAIIRDCAVGREMARLMSLVMMVFILIPAIAPALGQAILLIASWRGIFMALLLLSSMTLVWFYLRQPETLSFEARRPISPASLGGAFVEVLHTRSTVLYTLAGGMIFGSFVGFLNSAQQIFQELYGLGVRFPAYFAVLALTIGCASLINARLVIRLGMRFLCILGLGVTVLTSAVFLVYCLIGDPGIWLLMAYLMVTFFCTGILFGNINALAMEPLGHMAGLASSMIGSAKTLISLLLGYVIGYAYDSSVVPLVTGFFLLSALAFGLMWLSGSEAPTARQPLTDRLREESSR